VNRVELAELPLTVFTSRERWQAERIGALALYCSDGRWGEAFDEFCHRHLQIPRYDRWAVPGGPAWLAARDDGDAFAEAVRTQLDFLVCAHELNRIVLIAHYGCAWYGHLLGLPAEECLALQMEDVDRAAVTLRRRYPGVRVEGYLAMRSERTRACLDMAPQPLHAEGYLTPRAEGRLSFHRLDV
jgi:hypothetical protein